MQTAFRAGRRRRRLTENQQSGYVMVSGPATIVEEGALEHINMLAEKYLGDDKYPYLGPGRNA